MTKEEMTYKGLELVGYAGDARASYLMALQAAKQQDFVKAEKLIAEGEEMIIEAHKSTNRIVATWSTRKLL